ncbi:hypothetical protein [Oceanobacillus halotolerans]|uniref:hypothetical protein n=1 Tax=Oceanobacillus halotolerans TaxID=2663380 RepID=UPI0013DD4E99|nr:hypothetical protein [Oceanobacillus halotolerans]
MFKRIGIYIVIILFIMSIYKDLQREIPNMSSEENTTPSSIPEERADYTILKVKVSSGDTVLSVIDQIHNKSLETVDIGTIMADFHELNPNADPHHLSPNTYYFFPQYHTTDPPYTND